jgi:hypothetical protein
MQARTKRLLAIAVAASALLTACAGPRVVPAERLRLQELVGQRVEIPGELQGGDRLGDYINVADQAIYLPDARMTTVAPYGSRVVVSGRLQYDAGVTSDCTVEPDCVASIPAHYFIPGASVRLQ